MHYCDLTRYKVVYNEKVLKALTLMDVRFPQDKWIGPENPSLKPEHITLLAINADGVIEAITGKTEEFQFIPILNIR